MKIILIVLSAIFFALTIGCDSKVNNPQQKITNISVINESNMVISSIDIGDISEDYITWRNANYVDEQLLVHDTIKIDGFESGKEYSIWADVSKDRYGVPVIGKCKMEFIASSAPVIFTESSFIDVNEYGFLKIVTSSKAIKEISTSFSVLRTGYLSSQYANTSKVYLMKLGFYPESERNIDIYITFDDSTTRTIHDKIISTDTTLLKL
jgi:hypothetical protein